MGAFDALAGKKISFFPADFSMEVKRRRRNCTQLGTMTEDTHSHVTCFVCLRFLMEISQRECDCIDIRDNGVPAVGAAISDHFVHLV